MPKITPILRAELTIFKEYLPSRVDHMEEIFIRNPKENIVNTLDTIVSELRAQKQRIDAALVALVGSSDPITITAPFYTPSETVVVEAPLHHRTMSPTVRKKISESMKQTWEARGKSQYRLSPEIRKKIATSQRARWAAIKAAAKQVQVAAA